MTKRAASVIGTLVLFSLSAFPQTTGTPPFSSISGGPDAINLASLNAHYSMPVFGRLGRGIPLSFVLSVDSSIWTMVPPVFPSTLSTWVHSPTWGRSFGAIPASGAVFYTITQLTCHDPVNGNYPYNQLTATTYLDGGNTSHSFNVIIYDDPCTTGKPQTATGIATDGSNAMLKFSYPFAATVTTQDGEVIQPLVMDSGMNVSGGPTYTRTDSNGNRITINARAAQNFLLTSVVDTLGTTGVSSTGTPPSAVNYTYTSPSGASVSVVATYVTLNVQLSYGCSNASGFGPQSNTLLDRITLPDGSFYKFTYEPTTTGSGNTTARIASVKLPTGGTISYNYVGGDTNRGIFCADGSNAGFDRTTPDGTWQYRRTAGGTSTSFTTTVTDPQGKATVVSFSGNYETQRLVYDGAAGGTLLSSVVTCYNGNTSSCPTATVPQPPFTQVTTLRSLNGGPQAQTDVKYTSGLVTETDEYDFGATTPTRKTLITYDATLGNNILDKPSTVKVFDGGGTLASETDSTYDEDQGSLQTSGAAQRVAVTCTSGFTKCRGNLTTSKRYKTSSTTLNQTFTHYDTGQVYRATDANGAVTTNTYGACGNSLLTSVSLPLSLSSSSTWNCTGGVVLSVTDENSKMASTSYTDPYFWRPASTTDQTSNVTSFSYPSLTRTESTMSFNSGSSVTDHLTQLDSLGRVVVSQTKQGPSATSYDSVETDYDSVGRVHKVTLPYSGAAGALCSGTCPGTTYSYDGFGRTLTTTDAGGGSAAYTYSRSAVYQTLGPAPAGENAKRKQLEYDGLGRMTSVCEVTSASGSGMCSQNASQPTGYWTKYAYGTPPNVNSEIVTQNAQGTSQTRTYISDMLGRMTTETNPETGTTSYGYDSDATCGTSSGDLVKKTDAVGNVTCYAYDALHRITSVTYPSGSYAAATDKKFFVYDAAVVNAVTMQNAKGRLAEAYTCPSSGACSPKKTDVGLSYSARGEVADEYQATGDVGIYFHSAATYWANGVVRTLGLYGTSGTSLIPLQTYGVDGEGRWNSVSAASGQNPVNSAVYDLVNYKTTVTYGSLDSDIFTFDASTGRMNRYDYNVVSQTVTGNLTWNTNGSLKTLAITDPLNSLNAQTCNYTHDDLGRGQTANCGTKWNQSFSFDPFGNINKTATVGTSFTPTYNLATNRIQALSGCTVTYDANGLPLQDCARGLQDSYTWDADGKPVNIDGETIVYDALGRGAEAYSTVYHLPIVYAPTGQKLGQVVNSSGTTYLYRGYVPLPGGGKAVYVSSGLSFYLHPDWLGSGRLETTPSRTVYQDVAYAPYGENYSQSGATYDLSFTGQTQDEISVMYDFLYRDYSAIAGRWYSPDPAGLGAVDPSSPQTWNRYAYVAGNPLNAVDLLGLTPRSDCIGCINYDFSNSYYVNGIQVSAAVGQALLGLGRGGFNSFTSSSFLFNAQSSLSNGPIIESYWWDTTNVSHTAWDMGGNVIGSGETQNTGYWINFSLGPQPLTGGFALALNTATASSGTAVVTRDRSNWLQRMGDRVNNWMDDHSKAIDAFVCLSAPGPANDIADLSAQIHEHNEIPEGAGGAAIWMVNINSQRQGGQAPYGSEAGAKAMNSAALGAMYMSAAIECGSR